MFANFHAAGRQIDLVVLTESTILVVEAKGYSLPVHGDINGQWMQHGPYGNKKIGNAYNQALEGKNAFRDAMQKIAQISGYPNAAVVISPDIPHESKLTSGDFKVAVGGAGLIRQTLFQPSGARLSQSQCEALAKYLGLELVSSKDAAINDEVIEAERLCSAYLAAFEDFYGPTAAELFPDNYECNTHEMASSDVHSMVERGEGGVLIRGPSGCGKTLLSASCAISCINGGGVPLFIAARDFRGQFQKLLDKEAALLNGCPAARILRAAKTLGKRVVLFLDGYNECAENFRGELTRSLRAFTLRYDAGIVVSTQCELDRPDLLQLKTVVVRHPSDELKTILAGIERGGNVAGDIRSLLDAANSGLEASLVGKIGALMPSGASKFVLFNTYARERLKAAASEGIRILCVFAESLLQRSSFSLSVREFDRLCDYQNLSQAGRQQLSQSQLLLERGDRVSFVHELLFSAFSAEAVIRSSKDDPVRIRTALNSPRFSSSKVFILGAVEDEMLLHEVLDGCSDQGLIAAAASGECGTAAQSIVNHRIDKMLASMIIEAKAIGFQIEGDGFHGVTIEKSSLRSDLEGFESCLSAVGQGLVAGRYLQEVITACRHIDYGIEVFSKSFAAAEAKAKKVPLRHAVFSAAYVMGREAAISKLVSFVHGGALSIRGRKGSEFEVAVREAWANASTFGQYYFLLGVTKFTNCAKDAAPYVSQLIQKLSSLPYHLQLDLIDFTRYLREAEEPYRTQIIDALQSSLDKLGFMMNGIIFEALGGMGALEEDEQNHIPVVQQEIKEVLNADDVESDEMAWGLFSRQFDHPFDAAYWEEIQGLDDSRTKQFLTKACRGASAPYVSFLGILIRQLSDFNDPDTASAIAPWTELPDKKSFIPQDAIEVFVVAHEALGHLGASLPLLRGDPASAPDHALLACGELYYWSNRSDVGNPQIADHTLPARTVLLDHSQCAGAAALQLTTSHMLSQDGTRKSLAREYPDMALEICREAIKRRDAQVSYFQHGFSDDSASIAGFSIQILGALGNEDDLQLLKALCDHERHGVGALDAIKRIESRVRF
ncbi:NERD domain-containing protein [Alcanivorax sp. S71-1-4]|nr:NERD domain-containing protein [Alcanivorax sp. S71-1-4]